MSRFLRSILFLLALATCTQADASPFGLKFLHKGAQTPPPSTAAWFSAPVYDTSIGNGVDSNGFANLPLHAGDSRYYVNSSTGSDANSCAAAKSASTPKATLGGGMACRADGTGDQVVVAENTGPYSDSPSFSGFSGGFSLLYPAVVQSYDPTDPTNEAKMGRAFGTGSHARPVINNTFYTNSGNTQYVAIRGFNFSVSNAAHSDGGLKLGDGWLIENNLLPYQQLELQITDNPHGIAKAWIVRGNAIYGVDPSQAAGIYASGGALTIEDNVFYHNGWHIGATRDDATLGANIFTHGSCYCQHSSKVIFRRNLVDNGSADGGSTRDDTIAELNVFTNNPVTMGVGGGNRPDLANPYGDSLDFSFNAILAGNDLNTSNPRGWGIQTVNGKAISAARYNIFAHNLGTQLDFALGISAVSPQPSYMLFDNNIAFQWSPLGHSSTDNGGGTYVSYTHPTFTNNKWDDPTSGSNTNVSGLSFPNSSLSTAAAATALGYADYPTLIAYALANPEAHVQRALLSTIMSAYGITGPPALVDLAIGTNSWRTGNKDAGPIINTQDGTTLTFGGTWPTGLTWDSNSRFWHLDGTGSSATSGTGTITETRSTDSAIHTTNIAWTLPKAPILTSASVTVTNSTTATLHVTTDVGDGTLYWIAADTDANQVDAPSGARYPGEVIGDSGFNNGNFNPGWVHHGSQTVTATGVQTILVTGLTSGRDYYFSPVHVSAAGVVSATVDGRYTIGPIHFVQP